MDVDLDTIRKKLYVAVISDILDNMGYTDQVMNIAIRPLREDDVLVGPARTLLAVPEYSIPDNPYDVQIDATDLLEPGDVIVANTSDVHNSAFWGELFSTAALARGALGAVIDGYIRDVRKNKKLEFPVFSKGMHPVNSKGRLTVLQYDEPIRCGGVFVRRGDYVFAEIDGSLVIPREIVGEVFDKALKIASKENKMRSDIEKGSSLRAAWEKHRVL
jgi:4-hydroxy-4-methyl-2-oxoglutarate aldolase